MSEVNRTLHEQIASGVSEPIAQAAQGVSKTFADIGKTFSNAWSYSLNLWRFFSANFTSRQRVAIRLDRLSELASHPVSRGHALDELRKSSSSQNRFEACYALGILGKVESTIPGVMITALNSQDPFVREAAAKGLVELRGDVFPVLQDVLRAIREHPTEGTALYAVEFLAQSASRLRPGTSEFNQVEEVLEFAAHRQVSMAKTEAAQLLEAMRPRCLQEA
ncbi:MAG: HEAT repeat domain-containing protein [Gemmataceae bacterium]|nr:HEAT repeat domain-containing protein [Gemmataceae bacterium]